MSGALDIEGVLGMHWSYEPTKDYDGWLCECGQRIAGRDVEDTDVAMRAHVAAVLREQIAAWLADFPWTETARDDLLAAQVAPSRVPGGES